MSTSRTVIRFVNAAHYIDHGAMLIFPTAVLGMGSTFGLDYSELLALSIGGYIAFGAGSLPAGWLGDRWSRRKMMALFFFGIGGACIATGLATTPLMLAAGLTLIGLFGAIYHPVGGAMLVAHAERLGNTIGINGVWGNLGIAGAALTAGLITSLLGWRWAFILPGAAAIAFGVAFLALVPEIVQGPRRAAKASAALPRNVLVRVYVLMAMVSLSGGVVFSALSLALPKLLTERVSFIDGGAFGAGGLAAIIFVVGAVAQLLIGRSIDRMSLRSIFLPMALTQTPLLLIAAYAHDATLIIAAMALMLPMFGQVTVNDAMVARYAADAWRARVYALRYLISFSASALAIPLVAILHDRFGGFEPVLLVMAALGGFTALGAILFPRTDDVAKPDASAAAPATAQPAPAAGG